MTLAGMLLCCSLESSVVCWSSLVTGVYLPSSITWTACSRAFLWPQGREIVADELIGVLAQVPRDHNKMTVSLLNEKWHSAGETEEGAPEPWEV